jgi:TrmH family RNA methyltransferase
MPSLLGVPTRRVTTRNAAFQQWNALLVNRQKRRQLGVFLVHGVRPISQAVRAGWPLRALLYRPEPHSEWAHQLLADGPPAERIEVAPDLLAELGEKDDGPPEVIAVAELGPSALAPLRATADLVVVADRPANPGNLGTLIRSADALGADAVVVVGHAADPHDPRAVRASRGSLFVVPTYQAGAVDEVFAWIDSHRPALQLVGTDETATTPLWDVDLVRPCALVVGSEAAGMSRAWRDACDILARIPMAGEASSLNAAMSASIALYEVSRQRGMTTPAGSVGA